MKRTFHTSLMFGFFLVLNSTAIFAQQTKQTIILINSQPCLVEVDQKGNIIKVIKQEENTVEGLKNTAPSESLQHIPQVKIQDPETPQVIYIDKPKASDNGSVAGVYDYKVSNQINAITQFGQGEATLSTEARKALDKVVEDLLANINDVAVIRSLSIEKTSKLHINRVDAVRSYLKLKGIGSSRIIAENLQGRIDANEVKVHVIHDFLK